MVAVLCSAHAVSRGYPSKVSMQKKKQTTKPKITTEIFLYIVSPLLKRKMQCVLKSPLEKSVYSQKSSDVTLTYNSLEEDLPKLQFFLMQC